MIILLVLLFLYAMGVTGVLINHHRRISTLSGRIDSDRASTYRLP